MRFVLLWSLAAFSLRAASPCQSCHPQQVAAYLRSPMGNAMGPATPLPPASFAHAASESRMGSFPANGQLRHRIERNGVAAEFPMAYRIGSGSHAAGYLARIGEWLFQSPLSYYRRGEKWDAAPGYETMARPDFNRRVTPECLGCHSSGDPAALQPISCEQCHGPSAQHMHRPARNNIVNPARLAPAARDAVCEQCHLTGEARIAYPGGYSVAVYDRPRTDLRVVSHVEQLALSACARASEGRLWCGTCHQPHGARIDVDAQCRTCHAGGLPASHQDRRECVSCHMPARVAVDGGHSAFTDHRIQRTAATVAATGPARLRLWRDVADPALRERNLGLAAIQVGERDGSPALIKEGYRRLSAVYPRFPQDPDVLSSLGMVLFLKDQHKDALTLLQAAVRQRPSDAVLQEKLALVRRAAGDLRGAITHLERSIALDPGRESAYFFLAECQTAPEARRRVLQRLLQVFPQSLLACEALRALPSP